jgi:hypothetical protein
VLGAERSGTSVCAEMVHAWGAYAGEAHELPAPDELNPRGRWEYQPLWDLLAAVGRFDSSTSWWQAGFPELVAEQVRDPVLARRARELLSRMESRGGPWVWKDPALCHFLGFWNAFWERPVFIIPVRHPLDIAASWQRFARASGRRGISVEGNLLRWQHMTLSVLRRIEPTSPVLFLEYERVTESPVEQARHLAAFLDTQCGRTSDAAVAQRMASACDSSLRRHRDGVHRERAMTSAQRSLHRFLRAKVATPELPFRDEFPMPPDWRARVMAEEAH